MVKIDLHKEKSSISKMEKIQIYPTKQQHNNFNKIKPKLIMSPLTTMPTKKLMIATNGIPMKPIMSANESNLSLKKEANDVKLPTMIIKNENSMTTTTKIIPLSMNDKQLDASECKQQQKSSITITEKSSNERSKETAGYRSEKEKITLGDVHPYITCFLCKGYLIEATTIVECLHTYCHSCLMKHLSREKCCPQCEMSINKSKTNIKYDATIQSIVYKLVPGLYEKELLRRRAFYKQRPDEAKLATPEERGDDTEHLIFSPSDLMSLSLDYAEKETLKGMENDPHVQKLLKPKFLNCPAIFKVEHLKKFILNKFLINCNKFNVEISYKVKTIVLPEHYTLMDVAYIYTWKKEAPMPFFFRIIAKNSKCNELPEVSLRRSPMNMTNLNDSNIDDDYTSTNASTTKKKSVTFKEDVKSYEIKAEKDNVKGAGVGNFTDKKSPPRVESIKLKFDVSNNNVSIIKSDGSSKTSQSSSSSSSTTSSSKKKEKEKKGKLDSSYTDTQYKSSSAFSNQDSQKSKRDEYEFDDEIEKQKLGFLNTFQLTAKKMLMPKYQNLSNIQSSIQQNKITKKDDTNNEEGKNISAKANENNNTNNSNANKRKSKEPVKNEKMKKYKFHEMKSVGEGNKFLFTKTGDGHEITFDMSPKPLGSKPPLSKVKSDILMAQQRADAKAIQSKTEINSTDKNQTKNVPIKPKKLPLLLPKQTPSSSSSPQAVNASNVTSTSIAPTSMSPTAFVIKKPDLNKKEPEIASTAEISVTKVNDQNHHYRVYGKKSPENKGNSKDSQIKSPSDVFAQPLPPKPKTNLNPIAPPTTLAPSAFGFAPKQPKVIPENMQTPYGCRTPFYVPSSPSYTPNFDPKPQFKYANPNAYASFMQSMFSPSPTLPGKTSPPINNLPPPKVPSENTRKRLSTESPNTTSSKRKSPSPTKTPITTPSTPTTATAPGTETTDTKAISILNKINFPSSLSVTLTNEQEENKKEQLRSQKQNVNNNIEIIKISEDKEAAKATTNTSSKSPSPPKTGNNSILENDKKSSNEKKIPELKKLPPVLPASPNSVSAALPPPIFPPPVVKALSDSKESFQRAFLESLMSVTNRDKNVDKNSHRKKETSKAQQPVSPDALKSKSSHNDNSSVDFPTKESKSESKKNHQDMAVAPPRKNMNMSLTPPLSKNVDKSNTTALKSLTPPPIPYQDHSMFSPQAVAASSAMQFNLMLNALNAAATGAPHFAFPEYAANIQRIAMLETLRKNVEKSNALLAMGHQMQQHQQQNQKTSPNSPSSSSSSSKH